MKRWFGSETVYNEKYFESKIRFYDRKINTNFQTGKSYYTQVLLEECKYVVK